MIESTEKSIAEINTKKKKKGKEWNKLRKFTYLTFSHDRYFATNFLLRYSTTVIGNVLCS